MRHQQSVAFTSKHVTDVKNKTVFPQCTPMETVEPTQELRENVHDEEEIQWVVRPNALARLLGRSFGVIVGAVVLGVFVGGITLGVVGAIFQSQSLGLAAAGGSVLLVVALLGHRPLLRYIIGTAEYAATDRRLIKYDGIYGRTLTSVPLEGVQDAEYSIGSIEKLFDLGTVNIDTDRGYEETSFPYTPAPGKFTRAVSDVAQQAGKRDTTGSQEYTPGSGLSTTDPVAGLETNLFPDEELLWVVKPDKTTRLLAQLPTLVLRFVFSGAFFGGLVGGIAFVVTGSASIAMLVAGAALAYVFLSVAGSALFAFIYGTTQYAATDRRVIEYDGTLGKRLSSVPLVGIQDAEYSIGFLENQLGIGAVTLDTDRSYEGMAFPYVAAPAAFARDISQLAASDVVSREATPPGELAVGDGIDAESPTDELRENVPDGQVLHWVLTPDYRTRFLSKLVKAVTLQGSPFAPLGAASAYFSDTTEYALTDAQLVTYTGRFGREFSSVPVAGIQDAEYDIDYVESRFAVGNVTVDTDKGYEGFRLETVANPVAVAREISEVANAARVAERDEAAAAVASEAAAAAEQAETAAADATTSDGVTTAEGIPTARAHKLCVDCDSGIGSLSAFCPDCGADQPQSSDELTATCRQCHGEVGDGDAFCRHCGVEAPIAAE